jgi:site-specific DNA recombinase
MANAAIYIRWSTEDQGQGTTLQVQRETCLSYCDKQGWYVPEDRIYVDDGYSAGTLYRPALDRLRADVLNEAVDTVVVYRLDRLSRDLADATFLVGREWKGRAVVRSATEDVIPERDEGWLNYGFRVAFADYERRVIRQRTHGGKLRRLQEGLRVHGAAPFGYRRTTMPGVYEVDEEKAEVVRTMFRLCADENLGAPALAKWLNERGVKPPKAAKWHAGTVRPILQNPVYKARIVFGREKYLKQSAQEPGPWYRVQEPVVDVPAADGTLPALVSDELWERTQAAMKRRSQWMKRTSGRSLGSTRLLTSLLFCRCGHALRVKSGPSAKKYPENYRCYLTDAVEPCPARPGYMPVRLVDGIIVDELLRRVQAAGFKERIEAHLRLKVERDLLALQTQRADLSEELGRLEKELLHVDKQFRQEALTVAEFRRLRGQVEAEKAGLAAEQERVEALLRTQREQVTDQQAVLAQIDLAARWDELEPQQRREVVQHFIRRIEGYRSRESRRIEIAVEWAFETDVWPQELSMEVPCRGQGRHRPGTASFDGRGFA